MPTRPWQWLDKIQSAGCFSHLYYDRGHFSAVCMMKNSNLVGNSDFWIPIPGTPKPGLEFWNSEFQKFQSESFRILQPFDKSANQNYKRYKFIHGGTVYSMGNCYKVKS
jgi:hypothetical protein